MTTYLPTRDDAFELLCEHIKTESNIKHALAVESVMMHMAENRNENVEKWGVIGLVHDLDWEQHPDEHCKKTEEILREKKWPEEYIHAVVSHGWGICSDVEPEHVMEKVLFTIDELTGLIAAACLVRPSRSVLDIKAKSVKKKWKDKSFAAGVDRSIIEMGAGMLGIEISDLITEVIEGMQKVAEEIGLKGNI